MSEIHVLSGEITEHTVEPLMYSLLNHVPDYTNNTDIFKIAMNTVGGSITDGIALIGTMEISPFYTSITAFGSVYSMGLPILASADERQAHHMTVFMYHAPYSGYEGKLKNIEANLKQDKAHEKIIDDILLRKTRLTKKQLKYAKNNEWFFTAKEALDYGIIDKILYEHPWHNKIKI